MRFLKKSQSPSSHGKQIKVDRDSVCMGDDCTAPNEKRLDVAENALLLDVFWQVAAYLPRMSNAVWAVDTGKKVIGYIIMDTEIHYELCQENQLFSEMGTESLHCSYFHSGSFIYRNGANGKLVERYPESKSLLEKVKCCMGERFLDELRINGGSLCIWGEWFGRPYDNFHTVKTIRWEKEKITIHFCEGESLYISSPSDIINEEKRLVVGDAAQVLWVWYEYGKKPVYENLYVRQYTKDADGRILRAEGKRRDVKDGDGVLFQTKGKPAVWIG